MQRTRIVQQNEIIHSQARKTSKEDKKKEPEAIEATVRSWMRLPSKPYCREGLALREAAAEMGIDQRLLSGFINNMYRMNFNAWINMLRIEEVKRLISQRPEMTLARYSCPYWFYGLFCHVKGIQEV